MNIFTIIKYILIIRIKEILLKNLEYIVYVDNDATNQSRFFSILITWRKAKKDPDPLVRWRLERDLRASANLAQKELYKYFCV